MLIPVKELNEKKLDGEVENREELERAWADVLRNANTGMMSWAEKNFRQKCIDILYHMHYYRFNQTIYLKPNKGDNRK